MSTSFSTKCEILAEVYLESSWNEQLKDFRNVNDVGLPLAYLITKELAKATEAGIGFIEDSWHELCDALNVDFTGNYSNSDELLKASKIDEDES